MLHKKIKVTTLAGFATKGSKVGETEVEILVHASLTSENPLFYIYINQISNIFLKKAGFEGDRVSKFLILIHKNNTADIYVHDFPESLSVKVNKKIKKGGKVFYKDISDIGEIKFPGIEIKKTDAIIYCTKIKWVSGLFFDFTRDIDEKQIRTDIGNLINDLLFKRFHELMDTKKGIKKTSSVEPSKIIEEDKKLKTSKEKLKIFVEGKHDRAYLDQAINLLGIKPNFDIYDIKDQKDRDGNESGGKDKLRLHFLRLVKSNHFGYKTLFVFDHDAEKEYENCKKEKTTFVIPFKWKKNENNKINETVKKEGMGIENLFDEKLFKGNDGELSPIFFSRTYEEIGGKRYFLHQKFKKNLFLDFIRERNRKKDFKSFQPLFRLINKINRTIK